MAGAPKVTSKVRGPDLRNYKRHHVTGFGASRGAPLPLTMLRIIKGRRSRLGFQRFFVFSFWRFGVYSFVHWSSQPSTVSCHRMLFAGLSTQ